MRRAEIMLTLFFPLLLSCPDWENINSFNPVFLWIRLAFWATAALFSNHSPRGAREA